MKNNQLTKEATLQIVSAINIRLKGRTNPLVVSLDGGSGAGKSTLPLIAGESVQYHLFSFSTGTGLTPSSVTDAPSKVIILDEIYSSLSELSDVVDFKVLVDVLPAVCRYRSNVREGYADEAWHKQWDSAEDYYFSVLCPPSSFDLIVINQ
ncbi:hypothetical protein [Oceanobacillus sp. FSL W7-1293]|uniref:hypothetical protein n=1 Tax=Oceanobacillus sp. FSL W7-1293 TaxID=2921699 RepID=UPI0030CD9B97